MIFVFRFSSSRHQRNILVTWFSSPSPLVFAGLCFFVLFTWFVSTVHPCFLSSSWTTGEAEDWRKFDLGLGRGARRRGRGRACGPTRTSWTGRWGANSHSPFLSQLNQTISLKSVELYVQVTHVDPWGWVGQGERRIPYPTPICTKLSVQNTLKTRDGYEVEQGPSTVVWQHF